MSKDVRRRLSDLKARRQGSFMAMDSLVENSVSMESFEARSTGEWAKYTLGIMQEVDPKYTATSIAEGERVKNQIKNRISTSVSFEYQGSVPLPSQVWSACISKICVLMC